MGKIGVRETLRQTREEEAINQINTVCNNLKGEGFSVEFGEIGNRTTYALLTKGDEEIVGYTFIRDLKFKNPTIGKLKALSQALARKKTLDAPDEIVVPEELPDV